MYCLYRAVLPRLLDTLPPVVSEAALCQPPCTKRSRPQQHPTAYPARLLYQRTSQPHLPHSQPKSFARRQQENPRPRSAAAEAPSIKTLSSPSATLPHCLYCLRRTVCVVLSAAAHLAPGMLRYFVNHAKHHTLCQRVWTGHALIPAHASPSANSGQRRHSPVASTPG